MGVSRDELRLLREELKYTRETLSKLRDEKQYKSKPCKLKKVPECQVRRSLENNAVQYRFWRGVKNGVKSLNSCKILVYSHKMIPNLVPPQKKKFAPRILDESIRRIELPLG